MKLLTLVILTSFLVFLGCDNSSDNGSGEPIVSGKSVNDSPTPYPVSEAQRIQNVDRLLELRKEILALEGNLIAPATEDLAAYDSFLKNENTGMARLFPRNSQNEKRPLLVNGGGSYFSFKLQTNQYGQGNDVSYETNSKPQFSIGFAGVDYGFLGDLGKIDIREVNDSHPALVFAGNHNSPNGQKEPAWREQQRKWTVGEANNGVQFKDQVDAVVGNTYVVRSVIESNYDIVAVFQVVRRDDTDGSLVIAWRLVNDFVVPELDRN